MKSPQILIVLVETSHPGNIGAVARAMKNMSLSRLALVNPARFPDDAASARASGADDILESATLHSSLEEALSGAHLVIGASARLRTLQWPQISPRACAELVQQRSTTQTIALVFGRENSGLTNEELEHCNYLMTIPTNTEFSSLNLAAAVQIVAYELFVARQLDTQDSMTEHDDLAPVEDVERFYAHLEQTLIDLEFLNPDNPRQLMRRLRRLFNRVELEQVEVNILRGVLSAAQQFKSRHHSR